MVELIDRNPDTHHGRAVDTGSHRGQGFPHEPQAVLKTTAVFVGPHIGARMLQFSHVKADAQTLPSTLLNKPTALASRLLKKVIPFCRFPKNQKWKWLCSMLSSAKKAHSTFRPSAMLEHADSCKLCPLLPSALPNNTNFPI